MNTQRQRILDEIEHFDTEVGEWLRLDPLLEDLFSTGDIGPTEQAVLLRLLERHPDDDGAGVLWSVLHGLEGTGGYESSLVASVERMPSHIGLIMLYRLRKSGAADVDGRSLRRVLEQAAASEATTDDVRKQAQEYLTDPFWEEDAV